MSGYKNPWGGNGGSNGGPNFNFDGKIQDILNGKGFNPKFNGGAVVLAVAAIIFAWLIGGFYIVQPNEEGVRLRFGKYIGTSSSGLHYCWPAPIGRIIKVNVTSINREEVGYRSGSASGQDSVQYASESLMLTGDENIVDVNFEIQWRVKNAKDYLFNVRDKARGLTVKEAAESAMRESIGSKSINYIIEGMGRAALAQETKDILQSVLDEYNMGIHLMSVQMKKVDPPQKVIEAFRDVQTARADKEREVNQAYAYANEVVPIARGEASKILKTAEGYAAEVVYRASGETDRFLKLQKEYKKAESVTKKRIYLDTMESIFKKSEKIIVSGEGNSVPILPLGNFKDLLSNSK